MESAVCAYRKQQSPLSALCYQGRLIIVTSSLASKLLTSPLVSKKRLTTIFLFHHSDKVSSLELFHWGFPPLPSASIASCSFSSHPRLSAILPTCPCLHLIPYLYCFPPSVMSVPFPNHPVSILLSLLSSCLNPMPPLYLELLPHPCT